MKLRFRQSALADVAALHDYIAKHNPRAAKRTVHRIRISIDRLKQFPRVGRQGAHGTRELVVSGLPYIVVYEVTAESVDIIAVFHASMDRDRGPADSSQ
jgi:toxin ParE1/3/4